MTPGKGFRIVHETEDELVVYKPGGMACEMRVDDRRESLASVLADYRGAPVFLPHRLDAVTCGLVLAALSKEAVAWHNDRIAERNWHKYYIARVRWDGRPDEGGLLGTHRAYLKRKGRRAVAVRSGGKPSFLEILAIEKAGGRKNERHVLIKLLTGRYHQIRVMFRDLGIPLCGDPLYGEPGGDPASFYLEHAALGYIEKGSGNWKYLVTPRESLGDKVAPALYERLLKEIP